MTKLEDAIQAARIASTSPPNPLNVREAVLAILAAAAEDERVIANLKDVPAGRALLRFTDTQEAIEFQAGDGRLHAEDGSDSERRPTAERDENSDESLHAGTHFLRGPRRSVTVEGNVVVHNTAPTIVPSAQA